MAKLTIRVLLFVCLSNLVLSKTLPVRPDTSSLSLNSGLSEAGRRTGLAIVMESFLFRLLMTTLPARIIKFLPLLLTPPLVHAALKVRNPSFNLYLPPSTPDYPPQTYPAASSNSPYIF